ncbi:UNVERIFIED_CONTAM: hypothetical protein K2H54_065900 [Gekko kuhli]
MMLTVWVSQLGEGQNSVESFGNCSCIGSAVELVHALNTPFSDDMYSLMYIHLFSGLKCRSSGIQILKTSPVKYQDIFLKVSYISNLFLFVLFFLVDSGILGS